MGLQDGGRIVRVRTMGRWSREGKLLVGALVLLALAVAVSVLDERSLPLFGGDRDLAARSYASGYLVIMGAVAGLAMPFMVRRFVSRVRALIGDRAGALPRFLGQETTDRAALVAGYGLLVLFNLAGAIAAVVAWRESG